MLQLTLAEEIPLLTLIIIIGYAAFKYALKNQKVGNGQDKQTLLIYVPWLIVHAGAIFINKYIGLSALLIFPFDLVVLYFLIWKATRSNWKQIVIVYILFQAYYLVSFVVLAAIILQLKK